jgi:hypothetical protein
VIVSATRTGPKAKPAATAIAPTGHPAMVAWAWVMDMGDPFFSAGHRAAIWKDRLNALVSRLARGGGCEASAGCVDFARLTAW